MRNLIPQLVLALLLLVVIATNIAAQQPFVTDDSGTTPKHHFHFGFADELDRLHPASLPARNQNAAHFELEYGLLDGVEIGVEAPLITIFNEAGTDPLSPTGIGDTNFSIKYNFLKERERSRLPALAIVANLEFPTGNTSNGLGSGLTDVYMNGILEKTVTKNTVFRLNGGILFAGSVETGAEGFKTRGTVFTGGGSLVKQFTPRLLFGIELTGASNGNFDLGAALFQTTIGGNYQISKNATFDFGVVVGKHEASPRFGALVGISFDF